MSIQSYLSGLIYNRGGIGPNANYALSDWRKALQHPGRGGSVGNLGGTGTRAVNYPYAFAGVLDEAAQPGGVLSELYTNRQFAGEVGAIERTNMQRESEGLRQLIQSGVNPTLAASFYAEDPYRSRREIYTRRSEMEGELQQNQYQAMSQMANILQQAERDHMQLAMFRKSGRDASRAQGRAIAASFGEALIGGAASIGAAAV